MIIFYTNLFFVTGLGLRCVVVDFGLELLMEFLI
jgi:hypothetical protein